MHALLTLDFKTHIFRARFVPDQETLSWEKTTGRKRRIHYNSQVIEIIEIALQF